MTSSNTDSNVLALRPAVRYTSNTRSIEPTFDRTPDPLRSIAMSVAFAEPVLDRPSTDVRVGRPGTAPARTTPRRPGPGVGPDARPRRVRFTAPAVPGGRPGSRACRPAPAAAATSARTWHLTDRGMAVVLVVAAALVAASIAVVGLTALRVTGESYQAARTTASAPVLVER
jgi:hypothetical protein